MKGKEGSAERVLNKIEANTLSDMEFKILLIRILSELRENYKNSRESTRNLLQTTAA